MSTEELKSLGEESLKQQKMIRDYIKQDIHSLLSVAYWMGKKDGIIDSNSSLDLDGIVKCGKCFKK
jgi:hypothetical protein